MLVHTSHLFSNAASPEARVQKQVSCTQSPRLLPCPQADPERRRVDDAWRTLMRFEIGRCRQLYAHADGGVAMLPPRSARCVSTARVLYSRILDRIEAADCDVFTARVRVPTWRKALLAARVMVTGPVPGRRQLDGTQSRTALGR